VFDLQIDKTNFTLIKNVIVSITINYFTSQFIKIKLFLTIDGIRLVEVKVGNTSSHALASIHSRIVLL
jgi:hypothetical protein